MNDLPPGQQLVAPGKWPVVGERQPSGDSQWIVTVGGLLQPECSWTWNQLTKLPPVTRSVDIHCVTRWSRLAMEFRGVRLWDLLDTAGIPAGTRFVSLVARSARNHSTSLPLSVVRELDPLLATHAEGVPLSTEHGGPLRVVVPGRYFYKSLKWLTRVDLLAEDRLGYWESQAGYHNNADPWKEERFLAADLDANEVRTLLSSRDFRKRDLRGLQASGMNLRGLNAAGARLRDAHFEGTDLQGSCFDGANLSGAHLQRANLRGSSFQPRPDGQSADLEGADFRGADLRGVTFRSASLFGAIFGPCDPEHQTQVDQTTQFDSISLDSLEATPEQLQYLNGAGGVVNPETARKDQSRSAIVTSSSGNSIPPNQLELVERLCHAIVQLHLAIPVLVVLEISRPLSGLSREVSDYLSPFLEKLTRESDPTDDVESTVPAHQILAEFLSRPDAIEFLLSRIDTLEQERVSSRGESRTE